MDLVVAGREQGHEKVPASIRDPLLYRAGAHVPDHHLGPGQHVPAGVLDRPLDAAADVLGPGRPGPGQHGGHEHDDTRFAGHRRLLTS